MKKAFNFSFVAALLGLLVLLAVMSINLGSCKWVHELLGAEVTPPTTIADAGGSNSQSTVVPTALTGEIPVYTAHPITGLELVTDGEFQNMIAGSPPPRPDPNAFNSWIEWQAAMNPSTVVANSMFKPQGTDRGFGDNSYGEGISDNTFVSMWGPGLWSASLQQAITAVPAGLYTASSKVLLGNHDFDVNIRVVAADGTTVLGYRNYNVNQASLDKNSSTVKNVWKLINTLVDVPSTQNVTLRVQVTAKAPDVTDNVAKDPFARVDDVSLRASPMPATTTSSTSTSSTTSTTI